MKDEIVQFVFVLFALVIAAAAEEILPSFAGVGLPLLLALVVSVAPRFKVLPGVMIALGAGAFEDALSALPPMVSICFFAIAALLSRQAAVPRPLLIAAFPAYVCWAGLCAASSLGDLFAKVLVAIPLGAVAYGLTLVVLAWCGRRAGIDG